MELLDKLNWRYATKRFDKTRKVSAEKLNVLLQSADLAPSSYGLQPFSLIVVENDELKEKLSPAAFNQPQVTEASHVLIWAARTDLSEVHVDEFVDRIVKTRGIDKNKLADYEATMKNSINKRTPEQRFNWAARQAYISLGFVLSAAAISDIDACPQEGFNNDGFDEILHLKERGLSSVVMATIGYRSEEDPTQHYKKVRKTLDDLVIKF
jgi:nitroreductase/dihydropteridine reductase